jgi:hypothetical protein
MKLEMNQEAPEKWKPAQRYESFDELRWAVPNNFNVVAAKAQRVVATAPRYLKATDHEMDKTRLFKWNQDGSLELMDNDRLIREITERLVPALSPRKLIEDVLRTQAPDDLMELYERAVVKGGKVVEDDGCYSLRVGGKPDSMFTLLIRD